MLSSHRPLFSVPILLIAVFVTLYEWQSIKDVYSSDGTKLRWIHGVGQDFGQIHASSKHHRNLYDVQNRTLGFQEVKVVSLPDRTDKQDAWAVAASFAGFDYQLVDGVDSNTISPKSLPYTMNQSPKAIACWRAHLNVLQDMVKRRVDSTLIFEDDADWDVALKSQLVQFARGSHWLLSTDSNNSLKSWPVSESPYGTGWDLLWFGHCLGSPEPTDPRRFVIPHDSTVEPQTSNPHFKTWVNAVPPDIHTRFVARQNEGLCTAAYAISLEGARKLLYHMSMMPYNNPVDLGYNEMCKYRKSGFTCIAPFPMLVGTFRPTGDRSRYSDIETVEAGVEQAHSEHLVFSARMNLDRLLSGETVMKSSDGYADITGIHEMDINEIGTAVGHEEEIAVEED